MNKLKQLITARSISLGLIILLAVVMYVSTLIPQRIDSTPAKIDLWRLAHANLVWLVDGVNLHSICAQPWFAVIILFAVLSLGVSSFDQLTLSRKKLSFTGIGASEEVAVSVAGERLSAVTSSNSYRPLRTNSLDQRKFIRNPWGYFGILTLHVGITLVLVVSLYVSLTGRQGALFLIEGEARDNSQPWDFSEHGILSSPLTLSGSIRLDRLRVSFDSKNQPMDVSSEISIIGQTGTAESLTTSINRISSYHGLRIYHASQYGEAFAVTFTDTSGVSHTEKILVQQSTGLTKAGYSDDFEVTWSPYRFGAKYFTDVERKSMVSASPELVVRQLNGQQEIARASVTKGVPGLLSDYRVQFARIGKWSKLIIVDIAGMSAIFAGFAVIMLGGLIHYMTPPRELIGVKQVDGTYRVYWKAAAFKDFYLEERDDMARELGKEITS